MALVGKDEFPPILALGFHRMSLADIRGICVNRFPDSITRPGIMDGLEAVVGLLNATGFHLEVWVNGSFMTHKFNPDDSDITAKVRGEEYDAASVQQQEQLNWFNATDLRPDYKCDCYVFPEYSDGHPLYDFGQWRRAYWLEKFGYSRAEDPKGLAVKQI